MRIVPPLTIDEARLTATNVAEPSPGEIVWVASTPYVIGDFRIRTETHRVYQALTDHTSATPPELDLLNWRDAGPTNRYAALDYERNTATEVDGTSIEMTITPQQRTQALVLFGLAGEMLEVTATSGPMGPTIYSRTVNLSTRFTTSWSTYFFGAFTARESVVLLDLPLNVDIVITIRLTRQVAGPLRIETLAIGMPIHIGESQLGASSDILDFSRIERDEFGNAQLVRRKNVPVLNVQVFSSKAQVPVIRALRQQYAASPLIFLALADAADDYFDSLALVGLYKRMTVVCEYPEHALVTLEAEGL